MKIIGYILASLTFFTMNSAQADEVTNYMCLGFPQFVFAGVVNSPRALPMDCEDAQALESTYLRVSGLSPFPLPMPILLLQNQLSDQGMGYSFSRNMFQVSAELNQPKDVQMRLVMQKLFAHEVGHQIMGTFWLNTIDEYGWVKQKIDEFQSNMVEIRKNKDGLEIVKDETFNEYFVTMDETRLALPLRGQLFSTLSVAYNELFADIVAALAFDDSEVIENAVDDYAHMDLKMPTRGFQKNIPINVETATDSYYYFASIRTEIWNKWVVPRQANKQQLLFDLMVIFTADIQRRLAAGEPVSGISVEALLELNKKNADELLKALGISRE